MSSSEIPVVIEAPAERAEAAPETSWRRLGGELLRSKKGLTGAILVSLAIFAAIFAPVLSPNSPTDQLIELQYASPSLAHPFGGDELGRDVLARTLFGAQDSMAIGLLVVSIAAFLGTALGAAAGYLGGLAELVIMRAVDFQLAFPFILLAFVFLAILGPGFWSVVLALCFALWVNYARVVRAETLKLRELDFVQASQTIGASRARILWQHVLPNILHSVIVLATLDLGFVIIFEASLTFLGLGVPPPTPTWGGMIAEGSALLAQSPWMTLFPAAALTGTVIGINLLGDWLRDHRDPSLRIQ